MVIFIGNKKFTEWYVGNKKITEIWKWNEKVRPKVKTLPIVYSVESALSDFPIYIKPSAIAGWWALTLAEAQSLRFYDENNNELPREIVSADEIYVKNTLATGTGNKLYLDWDWVSSDYGVSDTYGRNNVRGGYKWVYHLDNTNDSTSNGYNWTAWSVSYSAGKFTNAWSFNWNISSYINLPSGAKPTGTFTISAWIKPSSVSNTKDSNLFYDWSSNYRNVLLRQLQKKISFLNWNASTSQDSDLVTWDILTLGAWSHLVFTRSGTTIKIYHNWSLVASRSWSYSWWSTANTFIIGADGGYTAGYWFDWLIEECRIIHWSEMPSSWISTEYANQSNPATFFWTLS